MTLLFVYGSLKEGYPNFHINKGRRLPGDFQTVQPLSGSAAQALTAHVYVQTPQVLKGAGPHLDPIAEYTLEHATLLAW